MPEFESVPLEYSGVFIDLMLEKSNDFGRRFQHWSDLFITRMSAFGFYVAQLDPDSPAIRLQHRRVTDLVPEIVLGAEEVEIGASAVNWNPEVWQAYLEMVMVVFNRTIDQAPFQAARIRMERSSIILDKTLSDFGVHTPTIPGADSPALVAFEYPGNIAFQLSDSRFALDGNSDSGDIDAINGVMLTIAAWQDDEIPLSGLMPWMVDAYDRLEKFRDTVLVSLVR